MVVASLVMDELSCIMDDTVITWHPKMEMDGSDDFPLQRDDFQVPSWFSEVYQESFSERFQ